MSDTMLRSERNTARLGRKGHRNLCDVLTNHTLRAREKRGWFKDQEVTTDEQATD